MSKKLLFIILLISLAFNIAFVGSFLFWHYKFKSDFLSGKLPREIMDHRNRHQGMMNDRQGPRDDQPPPPPGFRRGDMGWMGNREIIKPYRDKFDQSKTEFYRELQRPKFNEDLLKQKLETSLVNHTELEKKIGLRLIEMRKKMTPQEADQFFGRHTMRSMMLDNYDNSRPNPKRRNQ